MNKIFSVLTIVVALFFVSILGLPQLFKSLSNYSLRPEINFFKICVGLLQIIVAIYFGYRAVKKLRNDDNDSKLN